MALNWQWDECFGKLEIENQGDYKIRIYQGNALAIFLNEWENENGGETRRNTARKTGIKRKNGKIKNGKTADQSGKIPSAKRYFKKTVVGTGV